MRHRENIFDLYNSQNENKKQPEPERIPEEVRPEDLKDPEPEPKQEPNPEPSQDPEPKQEEGGNSDGVQ